MRSVVMILVCGGAVAGCGGSGGGSPAMCGDGICSGGETSGTCCDDCGCTSGLACIAGSCSSQPMCGASGDSCTSSTTCCSSLTCIEGKCGTSSVMNVSLSDGCNNGESIEYKFFDAASSWVWPSATMHYSISAGQSAPQSLTCRTGDLVCIGGNEPNHNLYWGVGFQGTLTCSANVPCCWTCANGQATYAFSCN